MGRKNYERALKDMGIKNESIIIRMADGSSRKFDNFDDVRAFYEMMDRTGKMSQVHPDERDLASILQSKAGSQFEPYRTHGAYNRLLSYGENVGQLYGNRFKTDLIDTLANSKDPNVKAYVNRILTSKDHQNIIQEAYGIKEKDTYREKLTKAGTLMAMAANLKSFMQAAASTPIKVASMMLTDMAQGNTAAPTAMLGAILKNKNVKNVLTSE